MTEFQPKFDNLVQIFRTSVASFGDRPLFGTKSGAQWHWLSYREFGEQVDLCRGALAAMGIERGDRVAIISNNRPEWAIACYATYGLGAGFVPMYESQLDKDWRYILGDCEAKIVIVADVSIAARLAAFRTELPALQKVVVLAPQTDVEGTETFDSFLESGRANPIEMIEPQSTDVAGFIYTSGTTGNPKGVLLAHGNLAHNVSAIHEIFPISPEDRSLSFLPWAHSFGQTVELHALFSMGASMGIAESVNKIVDNLSEVKPTLLFSVPRIFNRIYDGLHKKMNEAGGLKLALFQAAVTTAVQKRELSARGQSSLWVDLKHSILDKVIFAKVRERFGGRLKYAFSGGAALSKQVAQFIDDLGIMVYEGYGLTETSPIATANYPGARTIGSVGRSLPGIDVEIDIAATEDPEQGEIVVYGHNVMLGYHGLKEENDKVLLDKGGVRGFRTGDMGYLDQNGFLFITGRIKEQYKLLNGKYVVPSQVEEKLKLSPFITNAMVYGANQNYNVALVIPDFEALELWARDHSISADRDNMARNERIQELIRDELDKYSAECKQYEKVRKFVIGTEEFTTDNGMLTPTLKLKRREVIKVYRNEIESLYAEEAAA